MKSFEYTITDPVGIHARPAGILVKKIKEFTSTVTVIKGEKSEGADEDTAAAAIEEFFKANL